MNANTDAVTRHYAPPGEAQAMVARVIRQVAALGDVALTAAQLAPLDQVHIRGLVATAELALLAAVGPSMRVLDAGCGLGGPSRYLAERFGCEVTGVDITPAYIELARWLAGRSPAAALLRYELADLCGLPMTDEHFDLVWTQHALMNVADRERAYAEFHRVLRPGGRLACYDIVAASGRPALTLPLPWATEPAGSHLLTAPETIATLEAAGFERQDWVDVTRLALNWFGQPMPLHDDALNLVAVMGERMKRMAGNLALDLHEGRLAVVMGVFTRRPA